MPEIYTCGKGIKFTYEGDLDTGVTITYNTGLIKVSSRLLKEAISHFRCKIVKGGFRADNPSSGGFGKWVRDKSKELNITGLTPPHGSRIAAILEHMGYLRCHTQGREGVTLILGAGRKEVNAQSAYSEKPAAEVELEQHPIINSKKMELEDQMFEYEKFPEYYMNYFWDKKHKLFGHPPDSYPNFPWIASLEERFQWVIKNYSVNGSASRYLIREMIEWGGSQGGVLQKFNDGLGEVNLYEIIGRIISSLSNSEESISYAITKLPGLGLTYASKLLRFMNPEMYGALDGRIRDALFKQGELPKIFDGNHRGMVSGYLKFLSLLQGVRNKLQSRGITKPNCRLSDTGTWRSSDIEMALFCWAGDKDNKTDS